MVLGWGLSGGGGGAASAWITAWECRYGAGIGRE